MVPDFVTLGAGKGAGQRNTLLHSVVQFIIGKQITDAVIEI